MPFEQGYITYRLINDDNLFPFYQLKAELLELEDFSKPNHAV